MTLNDVLAAIKAAEAEADRALTWNQLTTQEREVLTDSANKLACVAAMLRHTRMIPLFREEQRIGPAI